MFIMCQDGATTHSVYHLSAGDEHCFADLPRKQRCEDGKVSQSRDISRHSLQ